MLKKFAAVLLLVAAPLTLSQVQAQQAGDQPPIQLSPEEQALVDQMQAMRDEVFQNMMNRGMDPQELINQYAEQWQNGTLDPQALMQNLVEQGLTTQDRIAGLTGSARNAALSNIRRELGSSDEEWGVISPKLQRVVAAISDAEQSTLGRLSGRILTGAQGNSPMDNARRQLKEAVEDPNVSVERLTIVLNNWRANLERAKIELADARSDLLRIVTLRQEAILLGMGVL